jgi:hypothetical protein
MAQQALRQRRGRHPAGGAAADDDNPANRAAMHVIAAHFISLKWANYDNVFICARISGGVVSRSRDKWGHGHGSGHRLLRDQSMSPSFFLSGLACRCMQANINAMTEQIVPDSVSLFNLTR